MKFNTNTYTSLIRHGNVVGTSHVRDLHTSLEQTDTAQTSAYRHYNRYASDTPQIRECDKTINRYVYVALLGVSAALHSYTCYWHMHGVSELLHYGTYS